MAKRLSNKDKVFADEYLLDLNAKNAALRAGFAPSTANCAAAWIREVDPEKPRLKELIEKKMADRSRRTGITADRVLNELAKIAFADPADIINLRNGIFHEDTARADTAAIAGVRYGKRGEIEIRMADKSRALELIGKHLGMFADKVLVEGSLPVIIDDTIETPTEEAPECRIGFDAAAAEGEAHGPG